MYQDIIREMRKQCRLQMNGVASSSMREKGLNYKLNFGLMIQQIKDIAKGYGQYADLAETLWKEDTRELKILATLLYPYTNYSPDTANRWIHEIPNQEVREQVVMNLFQFLPFALTKALEWSNSENEEIRTTGYWLLSRLFLSKLIDKYVDFNYFCYIWEDIAADSIFLKNASPIALKHIGKQSKDIADSILNKINETDCQTSAPRKEVLESLSFEFDFFFKP